MIDPLTAEKLQEIFSIHVLRGPKGRQTLNMPSDAAILKLTDTLNYWRSWYLESQRQESFNSKLEIAETAIKKLCEVMPEIYNYRKMAADAGDPFSAPMAKALERLIAAIGIPNDPKLKPFICVNFQREDLPQQFKDWKWLNGKDEVLLKDFQEAVLSTNPNFKAGLNQNGPFARYASVALQFVTGMRPKTSTVAARMKELGRVGSKS